MQGPQPRPSQSLQAYEAKHAQPQLKKSSILGLDPTKHLLQHALEKPLHPISHAHARQTVPVIDVAEDLARLEHEAADVLVRLAFEDEVLLDLLLLM